jgi:Tol biopolymer transport system component
MTITAGSRLGPFEVNELLGAGGMGAVYRAYDSRLRREVAIKVLSPEFSGDPDRRRRFEQEAQAIARLSHPNILAVYDTGTQDGCAYLVTELLDGEPLRSKLTGRPLALRRAIDYAVEVARGLAAAHERGIVHRDIKPGNLIVTKDGRVKILDFGIAKLIDVGTAADDAATLTAHGIGPMGTAAYMSPEQARAGEVDHRTDLFSLGVVLYEMLAGLSPFRRATPPETMTAILREDPPELDAGNVPAALRRIVSHCLEKDPAARFQSARDLAFNLEAVSEWLTPPSGPARPGFAKRHAMPLAAIALLLAAGAGFVSGRFGGRSPAEEAFSGIHRLTDLSGLEEFPAMSPDLKSVAFTARVNGVQQIFVRLLAGGTPLQITKDGIDHLQPRWSPDSSSLVYFSPAAAGDVQGTVWETAALGGAPRRVIDSVGGGDLGRNGRIAGFRLAGQSIELVTASADSADHRVIARFDEPLYYKYPRWSPDGRWIAYQRGDGVRWDIFAVPSAGGMPRQLTHENGQIHGLTWLPDSTGIVYSSGRGATMPYLPTLGLWEVTLDGGQPRRIVTADVSYLHPDIHESGAMLASRLQMHFDLWKYPIDGRPDENVRDAIRLTRQTGQVQTPTVGASDREVAFLSDSGGHANLWVTTVESGEMRQITYERDENVSLGVPIWSPDGNWITFVSSRGGTGLGFGLWAVDPRGGNVRKLAERGLGAAWARDGRWVYYIDEATVYKAPVDGGPAVKVRRGPARNVVGSDGQTLYFMVDRTLTDGSPGFEIHSATPEDAPSRLLARIRASRAPQWQIMNPSLSPDGRWLAMPLTDGVTTNIWLLATATGEWRQVTDFGDRPTFIARRVSWSADGRSILAAVGEGDSDIVMFARGH